ncbi:hypothetical protein [Rhizobium leguminosarum]|uniref:hypothetical protein n=1 Tax=Rhizobium leguminosarum TaxID=384 RepID=UPI0013B6FAD1|nr:hypothetical protein [Rhizobium leguminosarum]NEI60915.1 hypothetical protein [Rhizobium leguminosarum]
MLLPNQIITDLDAALLATGEDVTLRRITKVAGNPVIKDVVCRAAVRSVSADEIVGTIAQNDLRVIISPTQIMLAAWPGADEGTPAGSAVDQRLPRATDKMVIQGKERQVKVSKPVFVAGTWVRCNLVVAG